MTDIVELLREVAGLLQETCDTTDVGDRLADAADELEASAEWALCKWLAEHENRGVNALWPNLTLDTWTCAVLDEDDNERAERGPNRADAIRAAIKAWEER